HVAPRVDRLAVRAQVQELRGRRVRAGERRVAYREVPGVALLHRLHAAGGVDERGALREADVVVELRGGLAGAAAGDVALDPRVPRGVVVHQQPAPAVVREVVGAV